MFVVSMVIVDGRWVIVAPLETSSPPLKFGMAYFQGLLLLVSGSVYSSIVEGLFHKLRNQDQVQ